MKKKEKKKRVAYIYTGLQWWNFIFSVNKLPGFWGWYWSTLQGWIRAMPPNDSRIFHFHARRFQILHFPQERGSKGNQSWIFTGRTDAEGEAPVLWPPDVKSWFLGKDSDAGKDWRREEKGTTEDEMVGWHRRHVAIFYSSLVAALPCRVAISAFEPQCIFF